MANNTCSIDGCSAKVTSRGWCRRHYNAQYRGADLPETLTFEPCPQCGDSFTAGRNRKFCSQRCRELAKYEAMKADPEAWAAFCAKSNARYVKVADRPGYTKPVRPKVPCSLDDCDRVATSRKMCTMHYRRWARATGLEKSPSSKWTDVRRSKYHARRARMKGANNGDKVLLADLLERDGATCSACHEHIDVDLAWPEPLSPSIDHTLALSKGGEHTMANTTAMHLVCNMKKGARTMPNHQPVGDTDEAQ